MNTATPITSFRPELCLLDGTMQRDVAIDVAADGRIVAVHLHSEPAPESSSDRVVPLPGRALVPGFANAHSHAFQRALRGRVQHRSPGAAHDDFWSWRETMYGIALSVGAEDVHDIAAMAFLDMVRAGFTVVGEFHYLHHQPDGRPWPEPNRLALEIASAAERVGIRLVLLQVAYARGGFDAPATPRQRRFVDPDVGTWIERTEALESALRTRDRRGQWVRVGIAPHSVRAVGLDWLQAIDAWRGERVCHMHLAEQTGELEQCRQAHGTTPLRLVLGQTGLVDRRFTAVHGTWFDEPEIALLADRGARVCACPATERDLGDGFLPGLALRDAGVGVCIGTDSHCQIDPFSELRAIELNERLRFRRRVVLATDDEPEPARYLQRVGSEQGYRALGLEGGRLAVGQPFDAVGLDLTHRAVLGCPDDAVLSAAIFAGDASLVRDVFVGGLARVRDGHHAEAAEIEAAYLRCVQALRS